MTDNTISFADARKARRHYPISGASDADIVDVVHRIDTLTKLYLSAVMSSVLPLVENLPLDRPTPNYEQFAELVEDLVTDELTGPLARITGR